MKFNVYKRYHYKFTLPNSIRLTRGYSARGCSCGLYRLVRAKGKVTLYMVVSKCVEMTDQQPDDYGTLTRQDTYGLVADLFVKSS